MTYSSVISRDSVWIALTIAALNYLGVLAYDIQNAYLAADCRERVCVVAEPKFGSESGDNILVRKALYGLKSSGAASRSLLVETLDAICYRSRYADPDSVPATTHTCSPQYTII